MNYTEKDYQSPMGINTRVWGPILWQFLHMISFNYPVQPTEQDKKNYYNYIENLQNILPCKTCRDNLKNNLKSAGFGMDKLKNRTTFSRFIYDLHNVVNECLGKKPYLTYEKIRDVYEMFRANCAPAVAKVETGCSVPVNKIKSRCVVNIVPLTRSIESFSIDKRCMPSKAKLGKKSSKKSKKKSKKNSKK
jgi:hypothetical protein